MARPLTRRTFLQATGATALVIACAPATSPATAPAPSLAAPRRGGTLVFGAQADPLTLDPGAITDGASEQSAQLIFEGLVRYTEDRKIRASLAESWEAKDREWTFRLRKGVLFHDGTPFNAAAVKAHFDRIVAEKLFSQSSWTPYIARIDVDDDATVRFTTKEPDAFFLDRLAQIAGTIESPASAKKYGKDILKNPVGTGPFRFEEWLKDTHVSMVRHDGHWGEKAYLDKVVVRPIPDAQARTIGLESGDIHMTTGITPEQRARLRQNPAILVVETAGTSNTFVGMNVLKKPFDDLRVRQALNHAIDKQAIIKEIYQGAAEELPGHVPPGVPGYAKTAAYPYDTAKAKKLLADAGYASGFSTTLLSSNNYAKDLELVTFLQQQFAAVGVKVKLEQLEWAKYLDLLRIDPRKSPVEMWRDGRGGSDAAFSTLRTYGCDFFRPNGGNTNGYCNPKLDAQFYEAAKTIDEAKRNATLKEAQEQIAQEAPSVWLFVANAVAASSKKVREPLLIRGGTFTPTEKTWLEP